MPNPTAETDDGCPIDSQTREWIEARASWLLDRIGWAKARRSPIILPTTEYFPKTFEENYEDTRALLDRMCEYAGLPADRIDLSLFNEGMPLDSSTRTSSLYQRDGDRFRIGIEVSQLNDPLGVAATMAHELGHVYLLGFNRISENADDHGPLTDLWTVFIGLGVLTANASIRETHSRVGRWYDWNVFQHGYLTMPMYGYALALLERIRDEDRPQWPRHLRPDVRHAFRRSLRYLDKVGLPKLHLVRTTSARPTLGFSLSPDNDDIAADTSQEDTADDAAICTFCGIPLPHLDADCVCAECRESIEENQEELEFERMIEAENSARRYRWLKWGALAVVAVFFLSWVGEWLWNILR